MSEHNTTEYYALIESLIASQKDVWGNPAVEIANSVSGLVVSDDVSDADDIWLNGNEKEIARELAEAYIDRFGQSAATTLRDVAADYQDVLDLPSILEG